MDWIHLARDTDKWLTVVKTVMGRRIAWNAGKFLTCWETSSLAIDYPKGSNPIRCTDVCMGCPMISFSLETSTLFLHWARKELRVSMTKSSKIWLRSSLVCSCSNEWAVPDVYEVPSVQENLHPERHSVTSPKHLDPLHHRCENLKFLMLKSVRFSQRWIWRLLSRCDAV